MRGLRQFTQQTGGPLRTLTLPILAAVLTLWLPLPPPGRLGFTVALNIAMTDSDVRSIGTATLISILGALLLPILALVLALGDVAPLDAAPARVR